MNRIIPVSAIFLAAAAIEPVTAGLPSPDRAAEAHLRRPSSSAILSVVSHRRRSLHLGPRRSDLPGPACLGRLSAPIQDDRDDDATQLPGDADRLYRLALWDRAEKAMREEFAKNPTDKNRYGLVNLLYRARKYDECLVESERLTGAKDPGLRAFALALKGACSWKKSDAAGAKTWCAQAIQIADAKAPNAFPAARRIVRTTLAILEWKRRESKHFILFLPPDSAMDADALTARLDAAFEKIAAAIGAEFEGKIEAYYFNDQRQADEILGVPLNFAVPRERAIYALPDASIGHGMAHVLSFYVGNAKEKERPLSAFLREGLACAFSQDDLWDRRMEESPPLMLRQGKLPPLSQLLKQGDMDAGMVAAGGAFVRWLMETEGKEKFVRLWVEHNDHADPWKVVYGKSLEEIDAAWRAGFKNLSR